MRLKDEKRVNRKDEKKRGNQKDEKRGNQKDRMEEKGKRGIEAKWKENPKWKVKTKTNKLSKAKTSKITCFCCKREIAISVLKYHNESKRHLKKLNKFKSSGHLECQLCNSRFKEFEKYKRHFKSQFHEEAVGKMSVKGVYTFQRQMMVTLLMMRRGVTKRESV